MNGNKNSSVPTPLAQVMMDYLDCPCRFFPRPKGPFCRSGRLGGGQGPRGPRGLPSRSGGGERNPLGGPADERL